MRSELELPVLMGWDEEVAPAREGGRGVGEVLCSQ